MLDRIPMFIAKWILMILAIIPVVAGGIASVMVSLIRSDKIRWDELIGLAGVGLVFHLVVVGVFTRLLIHTQPGSRIVGYSRGFWMGIIIGGYLCGIGLGVFVAAH